MSKRANLRTVVCGVRGISGMRRGEWFSTRLSEKTSSSGDAGGDQFVITHNDGFSN